MRKITLMGRIAVDAQKQITPSGKEYIIFRMGNNEYNDEKNAEGKTITYWFRITSWNQRHINLAKHLTKGKPVIVTGDYKDNIYQNKSTGRYEIGREITLDSIDFINDGNNNSQQGGQQGQNGYQRQYNSNTEIPSVTSGGNASAPKQVEMPMTNAVPPSSNDDDDLPF